MIWNNDVLTGGGREASRQRKAMRVSRAGVAVSVMLIGAILAVTNASSVAAEPAFYLPYPAGSSYEITQGPGGSFSHNQSYTRWAVDFDMPMRSTVISSAAGTVKKAETNGSSAGGYGRNVMVDHGGGVCTLYAHLDELKVSSGQTVSRGTILGLSGATGNVDGRHLHWGKVNCSTNVSMQIATVETGSTFAVGARPVSQNGRSSAAGYQVGQGVVDPGWVDHAGWASETAIATIPGGWEMFHIGSDNRIYRKAIGAGGWTVIPGPQAKKIATTTSTDGRVELFYIGMNNQIYHHWESSPGGNISQWEGLGGYATDIAAARAGSTWEVFHVGSDGAIYRAGQTNKSWKRLDGTWARSLAATTSRDGRVELFHVGGNGNVFHAWQSSPGSSFGGWVNRGGVKYDIAASPVGNGEWELYGIGNSSSIWRMAPWSGVHSWQQLAGAASQISATRHPDGRVEVLVVGAGGAMHHAWQKAVGAF